MLSKDKRLNLSKNFRSVASGKRKETANFKLFLKLGNNLTALVGISLAKQNFKKAHDRNRARRLSSASIETFYSSLPNNLNLIIMPKSGVLETPIKALAEELKNEVLSSLPY